MVKKEGLYYFSMMCLKYSRSGSESYYLKIDQDTGCIAYSYKNDKTVASCSIVRYLKTGLEVFVQKSGTLNNGPANYPYTNFIGFLIST